MRRELWLFLIISWLLIGLAGCGGSVDLSEAQLELSLVTPLERNLVKDQQLMVIAEILDASGTGIKGLKVMARILDADGQEIQSLECSSEGDVSGLYQSEVFVPPAGARSGEWRVQATASQGEATISSAITVRVEDTLGAQTQVQHGFYLPIPPSWRIVEQSSTRQQGQLVLDPMPEDQHKALLDIRYLVGQGDISKAELVAFVQQYTPSGYQECEAHVRQVIPIDIQGFEGLLVRGSLVARQRNKDYNMSLQAYRFFASDAGRTYTIVAVSDSDALMSRMSALLDALQCDGD